jgi:hypothetical protein
MANHPRRTLYYESDKALGHLYRAIDEKRFFQELRKGSVAAQLHPTKKSLMQSLWTYVQRETVALLWEHHRKFAEDVRES